MLLPHEPQPSSRQTEACAGGTGRDGAAGTALEAGFDQLPTPFTGQGGTAAASQGGIRRAPRLGWLRAFRAGAIGEGIACPVWQRRGGPRPDVPRVCGVVFHNAMTSPRACAAILGLIPGRHNGGAREGPPGRPSPRGCTRAVEGEAAGARGKHVVLGGPSRGRRNRAFMPSGWNGYYRVRSRQLGKAGGGTRPPIVPCAPVAPPSSPSTPGPLRPLSPLPLPSCPLSLLSSSPPPPFRLFPSFLSPRSLPGVLRRRLVRARDLCDYNVLDFNLSRTKKATSLPRTNEAECLLHPPPPSPPLLTPTYTHLTPCHLPLSPFQSHLPLSLFFEISLSLLFSSTYPFPPSSPLPLPVFTSPSCR